MARCCVHDFMSKHGGQLGFRAHLGEQAAIDRDLAPGQCPCVGDRVVQYREFLRQLHVTDGDQLIANGLHVGRQRRIDVVVAALRLQHGRVVLRT